jgi:Icc-related predicted phosphoesterase
LTRLHILSDLHCEFDQYRVQTVDADVIVLAGDIDHGTKGLEWARSSFPHHPVIYVAGNHEYYGEALPKLTDELRARATSLDIAFLENDVVEIGGLRFVGCTLWTDLALFGLHPWVTDAVLNTMLDYRSIRVSPQYRRLRPADTIRLHKQSRDWLTTALGEPGPPAIMVTHHAPSARSLAPRYAEDVVSAAYASQLDQLVEEEAPMLWIHGHTHHCVDYMLGQTRVVSNQRGYRDEDIGFVPDLVIDVNSRGSGNS